MQKKYSVSYFFFFWKLSGVVLWKDLCRKNFVKERGNKSIFSYILTAAGTIDCFECNSWDDPRCHDPFNYTIHKEHMPPIVECEGCCVKMVQFIGTGKNIHYTLRLKLLTKYCFMKQKCQILMRIAQYKNAATHLGFWGLILHTSTFKWAL